ncbi:hypothetical protein XMM379_001354 [Aliiroseovarius sp. xm-m-379]|uniref:type VI secretion system-associated protein TagO n=1 Tax=unclassified Aliiroseovarius TaxID=2623558 RepID=UPI00156A01EB|nr:hypothetical protein [Aliiroseovarius sp. xm-d-517]NRP24665.1 hypothetical protein [Aliiroseovarius sp. xm-m-379]NRP30701.1 hypothetical protein [Aliiroseovarius sp. xm-m-314]NRP33464.1 hypothetical protein [Aliiroseovarius sp. xm-a-104]NRP40571.1 hypothetical protein [Aliiroseovarius sp. xm-m-339-2]NRP44615.1 hypothetical protein [Aliiroseovarius sp. xm-m-378]NRP50141.1 hypothetical protein [Aliiroseovarius sp. xm-m-354]NRP61577.1 hypothetical protein [Aliiroseovarius sp. xm-a-151]NRP65
MKQVLLASVMLLVSHPALAKNSAESEIAACAAQRGSLERLQCYDDLAEALNLNGPQTAEVTGVEGNTGKWDIREKINPIDDSKTVVLALEAETGQNRWGNKVGLVIRCQSNKTEMYIVWNDYLGNDGTYDNEVKYVLTRIGDAKSETEKWGLSTDSKATFTPGSPIPRLKKMVKSDSFVAQTTPYNESPVTAVFNISGLEAALSPVMKTCGWSL